MGGNCRLEKFLKTMASIRSNVIKVAFLSSSGLLVSCAASHTPTPEPVFSAAAESKSAPFALDVLEEVNDGSNLHLLLQLTAKAEWDLKNVLVRLASLENGETRGTTLFKVGESGSPEAKPGEPIKFAVSVPSQNMTDYQLELLWGKEAVAAVQSEQKLAAPGAVTIADLSVSDDNCTQPCQPKTVISGYLENQSAQVLSSARLGIGFVWVGRGETLDAEQANNERSVSIKGLSLQPGGRREIKFKLSKEVPKSNDGSYQPVVRVLDFEFLPQG